MQFEKKVLKNGLRVVMAPMKNTKAVTLLVLAGIGSRYETKRINGISHFLEHLFFKGTKSRPKPGQVDSVFNNIGAEHNAFTSKEITGFWVKSSSKDFDVSLDIISDILLEPIFKEEEIEKERGVILQEIDMIKDDSPRNVQYILENVIYGNQPIGRDILGTKKIINSIKRPDIIKYEKDNYLSKNIVVVAAGDIDKNKDFKKIERIFGKIKKGKNRSAKKVKISQKSPNVKIVNRKSDQSHFALAFRGYDAFDKRKYALNLLAVIIGGNSSSRLYTEIRQKLGLAYYVYAWGDQYSDCGYLGMAAGVPHNKLDKVIKKIIYIVNKIKEKGVNKEDLKNAKNFLKGRIALKFEASDETASFIGEQELFYGKIITPEQTLKKIEKISHNDIMKVARDIFRPAKANMAVIGVHPNIEKEKKKHEQILNLLI